MTSRENLPPQGGLYRDISVISTPVDFVGLNVYLPGSYVSARDDAPGFVAVPFPAKFPTMNSTWLKIGPEALH
jgi:beta-glucosidase